MAFLLVRAQEHALTRTHTVKKRVGVQ